MTDNDVNNTIGTFRFGLTSAENQNEFTNSLYRELEPLKEWGVIPEGTTYWDIADSILDTLHNYAGMAEIPATELPNLINDILEPFKEED